MSPSWPNTSRATSQIPNRWKTSTYTGHMRQARAQTKRAVWPDAQPRTEAVEVGVRDDEAAEHEEQVDAEGARGDQRPQHTDHLGDPGQRGEVEVEQHHPRRRDDPQTREPAQLAGGRGVAGGCGEGLRSSRSANEPRQAAMWATTASYRDAEDVTDSRRTLGRTGCGTAGWAPPDRVDRLARTPVGPEDHSNYTDVTRTRPRPGQERLPSGRGATPSRPARAARA